MPSARAFGVEIWAHDPFIEAASIREQGAQPVSFDSLLEGSDYLIVQAPLTAETHHLLNEQSLRRMKKSAVLIDTARGPIVEDAALHTALSEGWTAGAALDDIEEEPAKQQEFRSSNPLFQLPNVIIAPHAAYYSEESIEYVRRTAAEEAARVLGGHAPRYAVNAVVMDAPMPH